MLAVGGDAFGDLRGELPRGGEDEGADLLIARALAFEEAVEEREGEASGLASAGLGGSHDIATGHDGGDGFCLNGRGCGVAFFLDRSEDLGVEAEFVECHICGRKS